MTADHKFNGFLEENSRKTFNGHMSNQLLNQSPLSLVIAVFVGGDGVPAPGDGVDGQPPDDGAQRRSR